jgi:sulfite reductase beta subunit-like hemoprotein
MLSTNEKKTVETANRRLLGVYPQKQEGLFMQRIKIFGGRISWPQWRTVAKLVATYTPQTPLHLTTRQDIEFHNVSAADLPSLQEGLSAVGLSTFGAGGDSVRNITVCTGYESCGHDVYTLANVVHTQLAAMPMIATLPRKFKISFSGCRKACAMPFINDLAFVAQADGAFTVIGAGSLGPKPATGIELYKDMPVSDIVLLCRTAIEFFNECGDRENRRKARLRHVRERLGDEVFKQELDKRFEVLLAQSKKQIVNSKNTNQKLNLLARLQLPNGDIDADDALALADFSQPLDLELRLNLTHGLELYSSESRVLPLPPKLAALTSLPTVVACPGCTTCPNSLTDCCATADKLRETLKNITSAKCIHISGCPNDCAQAVVADIGLIGLIKTIDSTKGPAYRILTNGGKGKTATLAQEAAMLPADAVPQYIKGIFAEQPQSDSEGRFQ